MEFIGSLATVLLFIVLAILIVLGFVILVSLIWGFGYVVWLLFQGPKKSSQKKQGV